MAAGDDAVAISVVSGRSTEVTTPPSLRLLEDEAASDWDEAVAEWLRAGRAEGKSRPTLYGYRETLLGDRLARIRGARPLRECLDRRTLTELLLRCQADGLKPTTLVVYCARLKTFARFCVERGWVGDDEATCLRVRGPRLPRLLPDVLTDAQVAQLLRHARFSRNRLIIRLLLGTGLRVSECAALTVDDLVETPDGWLVRVRQGKGRKDRYAPLGAAGDPLAADLLGYVETDRPIPPDSAERHLWLHHTGDRPMTAWAIWRAVAHLGRRAGVPVHPHTLRHTWATQAVGRGVPTEIVRRAGGWASLAVMQRYLHVSDREMLRAWKGVNGQ